MKILFSVLACLLLSFPLHAAPPPQARIAALLQAQGLAGAVWTTLDAEGAAGVSDRRSGAPMRVDQRVQVGSVAKTVLAVGILRLVSEGRLALDTPVATILPQLAFENPWQARDPVRIRHLLDHTAGLDDARLWHVFSTRSTPGAPLAAAFPAGGGVLRVRVRPGTRFSYSNLGYTVLGMVIEAVTGQAYDRYLDGALLAPLGMRDSTFRFVTQARDPRLAMGHFEDGIAHPALPSYVRPAGQFTTTAADMARFARFLLSDGRLAGQPFVDTALLRAMGRPVGTEAAQAGLPVGYGLGLRRLDRHGVVGLCHGGNAIGFRAMLCLFPETAQAFFIAINTDSEGADYARFDAVLVKALGLPMPGYPAAPASPSGVDTRAWSGVYIPAPNRFDSMRYVDTLLNGVHVEGDGRGLRLRTLQAGRVALWPLGGGLFQAPGKRLASHALLASDDGERVLSNGTQSWVRVPFPALLLLWLSAGAGVLGLVHLVVVAALRLVRGRLGWRAPPLVPAAGALALLLPVPLFHGQSFLQLGEPTPAGVALALATGCLPLTMLAGLALARRERSLAGMDAAAMLAVFQWTLVLAWWKLLPLRLWS